MSDMDIVLFDYLQSKVSPELFDLYRRAGGLIEAFDLEENYTPLIGLINVEETVEESNLLDTIDNTIVSCIDSILKDFTVVCSVNATLKEKLDVVEGLLMLENTEQVKEVLEIINDFAEEDTLDGLCTLLSLVTAFEEAYFHPIIEGVSEALILRLKEVLESNTPTVIEEEVDGDKEKDNLIEKIQSNLAKLLTVYPPVGTLPYGNSKALAFLTQAGNYESTFDVWYHLLKDDILSNDSKMTALNLYVLASCSVDMCNHPRDSLSKELGVYFPDMEESRVLLEEIRVIHNSVSTVQMQS